jgi:hypothetical protein
MGRYVENLQGCCYFRSYIAWRFSVSRQIFASAFYDPPYVALSCQHDVDGKVLPKYMVNRCGCVHLGKECNSRWLICAKRWLHSVAVLRSEHGPIHLLRFIGTTRRSQIHACLQRDATSPKNV